MCSRRSSADASCCLWLPDEETRLLCGGRAGKGWSRAGVCNFFSASFPAPFSCFRGCRYRPEKGHGSHNALSRPCIWPNRSVFCFCLALPAFSPFPRRKSRKYGLLRDKVPMFYPKSTDVSAREVRCFTLSVAQFFCLLPRFVMI